MASHVVLRTWDAFRSLIYKSYQFVGWSMCQVDIHIDSLILATSHQKSWPIPMQNATFPKVYVKTLDFPYHWKAWTNWPGSSGQLVDPPNGGAAYPTRIFFGDLWMKILGRAPQKTCAKSDEHHRRFWGLCLAWRASCLDGHYYSEIMTLFYTKEPSIHNFSTTSHLAKVEFRQKSGESILPKWSLCHYFRNRWWKRWRFEKYPS